MKLWATTRAAARFDINTSRFGTLSAYYLVDQYTLDNPYPTQQGGANVPGFNALSDGRAQLFSFGSTKAINANTVNEAHFSYMRFANVIGQPIGGVGPSLASQGFVTGEGTLGIVPLNKSIEGIENVAFNDFTIGVDVTGEKQVNNTYSWSDNLSHVFGKHTVKVGGSFHYDQVNIISNSINNGSFVFQGTETGSDFADYLLGIATTYEQGDARPFYLRNHYIGAFAQDSWQVRPNLVLNYGLRWDVLPPWHEKYNQIQTFVLGEQSQVYPNAPQGIVFPRRSRNSLDPGSHKVGQLRPADRRSLFPRVQERNLRENLWRRRQEQHSRGVRHVLHGLRRTLGRNHERLRALRIRLRQHRRAAFIQRALRLRHDRPQQRPAVSFALAAVRSVGQKSEHLGRLVEL